jgi:hypothetical protein
MLDHIGPQIVAHRVSIPEHPRQEILHPIGRGITGRLRQLPAVLALHRRQKPLQIRRRPPPRLHPPKARCNPPGQPIQPLRPVRSIIHPNHGKTLQSPPWHPFYPKKLGCSISRDADHIISSSAALQIYFGVRDLETARRVSEMIGSETLTYGDPLQQGRAWAGYDKAIHAALGGVDPFEAGPEIGRLRYETLHLSKQHRRLRMPDEVMRTPENRHFLFADGLSGAVYTESMPASNRRTWNRTG